MGRSKAPTNFELIERFIAIHGDRYDYSRVQYVSAKTKIEVICRKHGPWLITPSNHQNGRGCPNCKRLMTQDQFLEKAKTKHGDRYDYSQTVYEHTKT